jgi:hypothetical protein
MELDASGGFDGVLPPAPDGARKEKDDGREKNEDSAV